MPAQRYRKLPVEIEAIQLGPDNAGEVVAWVNDHYVSRDVAWMRGGPGGGSHLGTVAINTLEGVMRADVGDYVIKGVQGEFYPCKPDIFEATYEVVN